MKAVCLNMRSDTARLESFTQSYPACLPSFERWEAKTAEDVQIPAWWKTPARYWANTQNFIDILTECGDGDEDWAIFEDDCVFRPDFEDRFKKFMEEVPADWQFLNLGPSHRQTMLYPPKQVSENIVRPRYFHGTHALIIKPAFAAACAEHMRKESWPVIHCADHWLGLLFINVDYVKAYSPLVSLCGQGAFPSNLTGKECRERWFMDYRYIDTDGKFQTATDPDMG